MMSNPLIARFAGEPALVAENSAGRVQACLEAVAAHENFAAIMAAGPTASADFWSSDDGWMARLRPYIVKDGVLQIPVKGVLLNNFAYQLFDWATGYEYIWEAFKRGCADYAVGAIKGIAFVEDSPGGMVAGCWDAVDKMVALKEQVGVPVRAFAHESAYSAAYGIATVADHIVVSRTGGVGSIGTMTSHVDSSGMLEQRGLKITFIASDPSKVEGNSTEPLSAEARERIQVRIDELNQFFVSAVARSRGLDEAFIRNTLKAHCFTASQAVSNGLADSVGSLEDATSAFAGFLDDQSENNGEDAMADQANATAVDQAALDTARAEGVTQGAANQLARINAIVGSDEGKERPKAALSAALKTGMSADEAKAFLSDLPVENAEAPAAAAADAAGGGFDAAMAKGNPDVGAEAGKTTEADEDNADDLVALAGRVGLKGFRK